MKEEKRILRISIISTIFYGIVLMVVTIMAIGHAFAYVGFGGELNSILFIGIIFGALDFMLFISIIKEIKSEIK